MWFTSDQCHFLWKKLNGDFILRTRLNFLRGQAPSRIARPAGWSRASLAPDAPYADCAEHGNGLTSLQFRRSAGTNAEEITLAITNADVLQFERRGTTYTFSAARYAANPSSAPKFATWAWVTMFTPVSSSVPMTAMSPNPPRSAMSASSGPPPRILFPIMITSAASWNCSTSTMASSRKFIPPRNRSRLPTGPRTAARSSTISSGRTGDWGRLCQFRSRHRQTRAHPHRSRQPEQQQRPQSRISFDGAMLGTSA